jgi:uncharacterized protein
MAVAIIGREKEKSILSGFLKSSRAEFLALYGRRRIGKSYLVTNFFRESDCVFFYTVGLKNEAYKKQISQFTKVIGDVFYSGAELKARSNWLETFELLTNAFNNAPKNKKIVLFLDEFPWLATRRSGILEALDYYWNRYWVHSKNIKLIICGSSASWIVNKIINNKGGLHNRITYQMSLEPFNLKETKKYLQYAGIKLNNKQVLQIYMVTGGIPYYLANIPKGLSATQIVELLAFTKKSLLLEEFYNLFSSLFDNADVYIKTIRFIANLRYGIGQEELLTKLGKTMCGLGGLKVLNDLEEAGFIISFKPYFHKKRGIYYRVADEYITFYLDWIEPIKDTLLSRSLTKGYWEKQHNLAKWHSWAGYSFEAVCYKHLSQVVKALQLNATAIPNSWRYTPKKGKNENGAQIDLLFDRDDDAITICEIKYTEQAFVIDKQYAKILLNKAEVFKKITKTRKQIFFAIISANGLKPTIYSEELISSCITLDDLFEE